ncbi:nucleotidyl transferase AbiEii/AbiGii toxin family protein [Candidatus Woesebacteria bacterium]|nr:nucleotidyl transferase AbiEii/AbiGii toxin family protein [Candidatus Woesebacteria bacterium]
MAKNCYFKGGTAATMIGILDRFSVDLDFDLANDVSESKIRKDLGDLFAKLDYPIKESSSRAVQYLLGYPAPANLRSTVKIEMIGRPTLSTAYETVYLKDIDRHATVQTVDTMVANKLLTPRDRWAKHHNIAGRDLYDIYYFLTHNLAYSTELITEKSGLDASELFADLIQFVEKKFTQTILDQDLNTLFDPATFKKLRLHLKNDALLALRAQIFANDKIEK